MNWLRQYTAELISTAVLAVLIGLFLAAAFIGIDFGRHYDEFYFVDAMKQAIDDFDLFHGHYTYGGLYFVPGFIYLIIDAWPDIQTVREALAAHPMRPVDLQSMPSAQALAGTLHGIVDGERFILGIRRIFVCISALTILWVYLAGRVLFTDSRVAPLLGAAFVALSWEVGYHARFVAPDTMLMQFAALQLLFLARFSRAGSPSTAIAWIMLAAVVGGLGVGVKMTGVFLALPIGLMLAFPAGGAAMFDVKGRLVLIAATAAAFLSAWIITSPGPLWDALHFAGHLDYEWLNYTQLPPDHPYRVEGFLGRISVFGVWLGAYLGSPYMMLSLMMTAVAAMGLVVLGKVRASLLLGLIGFAAVYLVFLAEHRAVYVRNLLVLVPFVAISFAAGCRFLITLSLERAPIWWSGVAVTIVVAMLNTFWMFDAAGSINSTTRASIIADFKTWAESDADRPVLLSPALVETMGADVAALLRCDEAGIGVGSSNALAALYYAEQPWRRWRANQPGFVEKVFGSREINYVFAPSWEGNHVGDRIMVVHRERLEQLGADPTTYRVCRARED